MQWTKYRGRIDPARLVFIDETWTKTNMSPLRGGGKLDSSRSILSMQFAPRATASMHEIVKDAADADIKALADWVGAQQ
ncbi:MAG: hypothetical protein E5V21_11430 [Mesorhizobium sp.]|nr:MAG: hypothetical protein E5V21_11430 [Mesorhizobium sp.]TIX95795.1 MAG: hypothetical protein E5V24_03935 [Mesorhizobium sp.]TIY10990.1 MAG: hypothetical protein E5V16_08385 [Mesorhizobium sp.]